MSPSANIRTRPENKGLKNKVEEKQETPTTNKRYGIYKWLYSIDAARWHDKT